MSRESRQTFFYCRSGTDTASPARTVRGVESAYCSVCVAASFIGSGLYNQNAVIDFVVHGLPDIKQLVDLSGGGNNAGLIEAVKYA